jgi:hypothetical protein
MSDGVTAVSRAGRSSFAVAVSAREGDREYPPGMGWVASFRSVYIRLPAQAAEASIARLRTRNGDHEVDLVVVRDDGRVLAIAGMLASTVEDRDTKHLRWLAAHRGDRLLDAIVINTGPAAYRRPDGIGVVPLGLLGP